MTNPPQNHHADENAESFGMLHTIGLDNQSLYVAGSGGSVEFTVTENSLHDLQLVIQHGLEEGLLDE